MDGLTAPNVSISPAGVTIPGVGVSLLRTNVTLPNANVSLGPGANGGGESDEHAWRSYSQRAVLHSSSHTPLVSSVRLQVHWGGGGDAVATGDGDGGRNRQPPPSLPQASDPQLNWVY